MFKRALGIVILLGPALAGCSAPPPKPDCVPGTYRLNRDNRVQLRLSGGNYQLIAGSDRAGGSYSYDPAKSEIVFEQGLGTIGEAARREIHKRAGVDLELDAFLDDLTSREGEATDISQDQNGAIYIEADPDGEYFMKPSCRTTTTGVR